MRGMKEERKLFPGSNLPYSPIANKSKFLSLSLSPFLLFLLGDLPFVRISCPLWALTPIRAYLQETDGVEGHSLAPPNCWKRHIEIPPPHRGPPGNLPPLARRPLCAHTHLNSRSKPCLIYLLYFSYMSQRFLSLCAVREDGWLSALPSSTEGVDLPSLVLPPRVREKKTVQEEWPKPMPYSQIYWLWDNSIKQTNKWACIRG